MFYMDAEKQGSYFEGWSLRHFAFDSQRRHLYYSERERASRDDLHSIHWKKKLKVTKLIVTAAVHEFHTHDPHLKETDFFTLEIHGRTRMLQKGEPALEPLLCPSTGNAPRIVNKNELDETEIRDPFRLRELYESLRDQFAQIRRQRELQPPDATGALNSSLKDPTRTIQSPRAASAKERSIQVILRCQTEEDFRRFWYVVQSVLGYDKLDVRPYRGLPPYDPRNSIPFAQLPVHLWHTFLGLDKTVFYTFARGDLVGRDSTGQVEVSLAGCYLCITHDMILIMRDNGIITRWVRLQDVAAFEYNTASKRPFFALLTDAPSPDILFIPKPPVFGPAAIANFSGVKKVLAVKAVLQDGCFSSVDIRRAIDFVEVNTFPSVRAYFDSRNKTRRFKFIPQDGFDQSLSCMIPTIQLAKVWHNLIQEQRSRSQDDVAAIPLEGEGGRGAMLSKGQLASVKRRMDKERMGSHDEIVALPLDKIIGGKGASQQWGAALETPTLHTDSVSTSMRNAEYQQPGTHYISREASPAGAKAINETHVTELVNTSLIAIGEKPIMPKIADGN